MTDGTLNSLVRLRDRAVRILDSEATWETKYELLFSEDLSLRVKAVDPSFSYYDPDTTYEADSVAFVRALQDRVAELEKAGLL